MLRQTSATSRNSLDRPHLDAASPTARGLHRNGAAAHPAPARHSFLRALSALAALALSLSCAVHAAQREVTREFTRTLSIAKGQRLRVENKFGFVTLRGGSRADILVRATIRVAHEDRSRAEQIAELTQIEVGPDSGGIRVATVYPQPPQQGTRLSWGNNVSYSVEYDIAVPESTPIDVAASFSGANVYGVRAASRIETSHSPIRCEGGSGTLVVEDKFGSVDVARHQGDVSVRTSNASISVSDVSGTATINNGFGRVRLARIARGAVVQNKNGEIEAEELGSSQLTTTFAQVNVRQVKGDLEVNSSNGGVDVRDVSGSVTARTSFARVRLARIGQTATVVTKNGEILLDDSGPADLATTFARVTATMVKGNLKISSSNGGVTAERVSGTATVQTSFGDVDLHSISGEARVTNQNGGVKVDSAAGAIVKTTFGGVVLRGISGAVRAESSNGAVSAHLNGPGCQPAELRTSFGAVRVTLPESANYDLDASTSFGAVKTDFPLSVSGEIKESLLRGRIGRGGCPLTVSNRNGSIEILKQR